MFLDQRSRKFLYVFVDLSVLLWVIVVVNAYELLPFIVQAQTAKKEKEKLKNALKKEKKVIRTTCKVKLKSWFLNFFCLFF